MSPSKRLKRFYRRQFSHLDPKDRIPLREYAREWSHMWDTSHWAYTIPATARQWLANK